MSNYLLRWAEEVLAIPESAQSTTAERSADLSPDLERREVALREAALQFVNRAGARLVAACPVCHPDAPASEYLVLVPAVNDGREFRASLAVLRIPYPVIARRDPLAHLSAVCKHFQKRTGAAKVGTEREIIEK